MDFYEFIKKEVYEQPLTLKDRIQEEHLSPNATTDFMERMEFIKDKGIFLYLKDRKFPQKSCPTPDSMVAVNIIKRIIIESLRLSPYFGVFALRTKNLEKMLRSFNRVSFELISPFFIKSDYINPVAKEFGKFIYVFLTELGISEEVSSNTSKIFTHIIEYDNAYRYRLQDVLNETDEYKITKWGEILRLGKIMKERDDMLDKANDRVGKQALNASKILSIAFLIPKMRKALKYASFACIWSRFAFDEGDKYWVNMRKDYNFFGKTYEQRNELHS